MVYFQLVAHTWYRLSCFSIAISQPLFEATYRIKWHTRRACCLVSFRNESVAREADSLELKSAKSAPELFSHGGGGDLYL